jgi:chromosome partitioning protein
MAPLVIAFVSQKGGVGKSTLARALLTFAFGAGMKVRCADLDLQQKTALVWQTVRERHGVAPALEVHAFSSPKDALANARGSELLIIDTAGKITDAVSEVAQYAHLLVQPTSPSSDDLHISILLFLAMERVSVDRDKLAFALCRVLSSAEEKYARSYLASFGYGVLASSIHEHLGYREAMRAGRSICETGRDDLDEPARALLADLLRRAQANVDQKARGRRKGRV